MKNKIQLDEMSAIEIYKLVLTGEISRFPKDFWQQSDAKANARECSQFLIEKILNWDEEKIKKNMNNKVFSENKLGSMLKTIYQGGFHKVINDLYPNKFMEWEFNTAPMHFWEDKEHCKQATKWLIEKLEWTDSDIKNKLSQKTFIENGLGGMLNQSYSQSPYKAINDLYPNKFMPWEFNNVPIGFWKDKENCKQAMEWLIKTLKWTDNDIKNKLSQKTFTENGLSGMLANVYKSSPFKAINDLYPNKFMPWELEHVPQSYWKNKQNCRNATQWLINKLKWTDEDIKEKVSYKTFKDNGLGGMLGKAYDSSPYKAIDDLYPMKYKSKDFKSYQNNLTKNKHQI